eukprot:COSAG06_NODE_5686_length_3320_cov_2.022043_4_plen_205_part_00
MCEEYTELAGRIRRYKLNGPKQLTKKMMAKLELSEDTMAEYTALFHKAQAEAKGAQRLAHDRYSWALSAQVPLSPRREAERKRQLLRQQQQVSVDYTDGGGGGAASPLSPGSVNGGNPSLPPYDDDGGGGGSGGGGGLFGNASMGAAAAESAATAGSSLSSSQLERDVQRLRGDVDGIQSRQTEMMDMLKEIRELVQGTAGTHV